MREYESRNNRTDMTDRERRLRRWKLRRQRERRRKMAGALLTVCLISVFVFSWHTLRIQANSADKEITFKYYTGVIVKSGDTVWSIADDYIDYGQYKNKNAYVKEVCSINNLDEYATVKVGQRIIVPYYSTEFIP